MCPFAGLIRVEGGRNSKATVNASRCQPEREPFRLAHLALPCVCLISWRFRMWEVWSIINKYLCPRAETAGNLTSQKIFHLPNLEVGLSRQFSLPPPSLSLPPSLPSLLVYVYGTCVFMYCEYSMFVKMLSVCVCRHGVFLWCTCVCASMWYICECRACTCGGQRMLKNSVLTFLPHFKGSLSWFCGRVHQASLAGLLAYEWFSCLGLPFSTSTGVTNVQYCIWAFEWLPVMKPRSLGASPMEPSPQLPN